MSRFAAHHLVLRPSVLALMAAGCLSASLGHAQSLPAGTLPVPAANWLQKGQRPDYVVNGQAAQVNLKGPATVLNWNSLDVGKDARLTFNMVNNTDRVLNQVTGGAINNRTTIDGMLKSNGQVYIYNPNGIVFSKTATVDVNALVASSLKIDDQRFMDGLLSPSVQAQMQADSTLGRLPGAVVVQGDAEGGVLQQAAITAAKNGFILLAAPTVSNAGKLSAPDGQVALAAGTRVFLAAPSNAAMRGLLVEVGSQDLAALAGQQDFKPTASNEALGSVDVKHGNATMVGRIVNQLGLVSANTSVSLNGSIYLKAQDNAIKQSAESPAMAQSGGQLLLGTGSQHLITPDVQDTATAIKSAGYKASEVQLAGQSIVLESGSLVRAAGGNVSVLAKDNPASSVAVANASRVVLMPGSEIDVSGSAGVQKAMESNVITAELRGGELADNLLLRNSSLRGQSVQLDLRKASTVTLANVQGYVDQQAVTVGEFTATGGAVSISAEGQVQLQAGSKVNVSGGSLDYQAGHVNTTKLSLAGKLYDFETAPANLAYASLVNLDNSSSNFEAGYRQGMNAGSVSISAPKFALEGTLQGQVSPGVNQRNLAASDAPKGAALTLGVMDVAGRDDRQFLLNKADGMSGLDVQGLAKDQGFRSFNLSLQGPVAVQTDLNLPAMTQVKVSTPGDVQWGGFSQQALFGGSVNSAGGSVTVSGLNVNVAPGVDFDLAGRWVNDAAWVAAQGDGLSAALPSYAIKGGSLSLSGNRVRLDDGVAVDVSGGAWMGTNGKVTAGDAGSISLTSRSGLNTLDTALRLGDGIELAGYGLKSGGRLTLAGRNVWVGLKGDAAQSAQAAGDLVLSPEFLKQGGFAAVSLTANGNLTMMPGTQLAMSPEQWQLPLDAVQKSSSAMGDVASLVQLPLVGASGVAVRPGSSLSLRASSANLSEAENALGRVQVGAGALLALDPGADASKPSVLNLSATNGVAVDGRLQVPAGQVNLSLDSSLLPSQIHVSKDARIDVSGTAARVWVEGTGLATGEVLDGGSIRINGNTGTVRLDTGSVLAVNGGQTERAVQLKSLGVLTDPRVVHSNAGTVDIRSSQGIWQGSTLQGHAGGTAQGAGLSVTLDSPTQLAQGEPDRVVQLVNQLSGMPDDLNGKAYVPVRDLSASGVTRLAVKSQNQIALGDGLNVALASSLTLDAPQLVAAEGTQSARLAAPYVSLGNNDARYQDNAGLAADGTASLTVQATTLDLQGQMATQGFGQVNLQATGDIRLVGLSPDDVSAPGAAALTGRLETGHALNIKAQQIYPSTLTQFELALHADAQPSRVSISGQPGSAGPVLSAAGVVIVRADQIEQGGRFLAPQGQIRLLANESVVFTPGSVTSVAGNAATPVLLGRMTNGTDWTYTLANSKELKLTSSYAPNAALGELRLPSKTIEVQAPVVQQQAGAVLDLSGGGQVKTYDFVPGPGGSQDILQKSFAVLPGFSAPVAPLDVYEGTAGLRVGDQVYFSGVPGLAAGTYTLLPGHYALLPGGFAVQAQSGLRDMSAGSNVKNQDGSYTVSGYRSNSTDGRGDTRTSGFRVLPAEVIAKSSEFKLYSADDYFQAEAVRKGVSDPALPADAGHLSIQVLAAQSAQMASSLSLQGETRLGAAQGQRGTADVSAPNLDVISYKSNNPSQKVQVLASELMGLGAESVLLGGQRTWAADGVHVQATADTLRLNNSAQALQGPEWLLAARNSLEVTGLAQVQATGTVSHPVQPLWLDAADSRQDGALVALSAAKGLTVTREAGLPAAQGRVDLASGASLGATGSAWLEAAVGMRLQGGLNLSRGADLGLSAPQITLGDSAPDVAGVASLKGANLAMLNRLDSLTLRSDGGIGVYGNGSDAVTVGTGSLKNLTVSAPALEGHGQSLTLNADVVTLAGAADGAAHDPKPMAGSLTVNAKQVLLGAGRLDVLGFDQVSLQSQGDVVATAADGQLQSAGAVTVSASRLATLDGAAAVLTAGGDLKLQGNDRAASAQALGLGGAWTLQGRNVGIDTMVSAPSGRIVVQASGEATTGVTVGTGQLDVHGVTKNFGSGHAYTPAGSVVLDGGAAAVTLSAQSVVDVSAQGADAGSLQVTAANTQKGAFNLLGQLKGAAEVAADSGLARAPLQGSFSLYVGQIENAAAFDALNAKLNAAGMTASREVRVRQGDVTLSASGRMQAHAISVAVDQGNLTVAGELDARGAQGGRIDLYASQAQASGKQGQLTLASTAVLRANATQAAQTDAGSAGDGGAVVLGVSNADGLAPAATDKGASISMQAGSKMDVSGLGSGQNGTVTLRAPRTANDSDVAVAQFKTTVTGSRDTVIEAVKTYQAESISELADSDSNLNAGSAGKMAGDATRFMWGRSGVLARLQAPSGLRLTPGIEVRSAGDLTVSVNEQAVNVSERGWDLNTWRMEGEAGALTLRAQGHLNVQGSISDGFVNNGFAMPLWALDSSLKSWNMRLVGGADVSAAKPTQTLQGAGDVSLQYARPVLEGDVPVALVRTGTGSIDVAAGRSVVLGSAVWRDPDGDASLDRSYGAAVYTAGYAGDLTGSGFALPQNERNSVYGDNTLTPAAFGRQGGAIRIEAGQDVQGAVVPQLVNDWLFRQGSSRLAEDGVTRVFDGANTAWWARPDYLGTGIATLAGGDVQIRAGGSVKDVLASVASNAYMAAGSDGVVQASRFVEQGGGNLRVNAGQDILGGQYYAQKGSLTLRAGQNIAAGSLKGFDVMAPEQLDANGDAVDVYTALKPVLALGDGTADVTAGRSVGVEAVYNPTLVRQNLTNLKEVTQSSAFMSYGASSGVRMTAVGGGVTLTNNGLLLANLSAELPSYDAVGQLLNPMYVLAPGQVKAVALGGDVRVQDGMGLAAAAAGQLELMAKGSVSLAAYGPLYSGLVMLDHDPAAVSLPIAPMTMDAPLLNLLAGRRNNTLAGHTPGQLHAADAQSVRLVALEGDVLAEAPPSTDRSYGTALLNLPKKAEILAGRDVRNLGFAVQHNRSTDETWVMAGRDVVDSTDPDKENPVKHVVTGQGLLALVAGRDIDLGNSKGVVTRGNLDNAYLPDGGAAIMALAGASLPEADAATTPVALEKKSAAFVDGVVDAAKDGLAAFDKAIADRYAVNTLKGGNILVYGSQFKTEQGGALDLMAPKGSVVAGLSSIPFYLQSKAASENGIFTVRGGEIRVLVGQDFIVNQGRVFTLGGGDITMISQYGNIDAGRGSKTASSAPPPLLTTDASGNTKIDISGSISGSGIATLQTSDKQAASDVVALAPRGIFDAGDAGVRSTGKVQIEAAVVLNSNNISAAGGVAGAVVVDSGAAPAPAAASNTSATPDASRAATATAAQSLTLSVDVVGYGSEASADEDGEEGDGKKKKKSSGDSSGEVTDKSPRK
ncbi:filamentous haemagglutinin family protein [Limnohabitans sp. MMS-10A-160]|nr:filamentous haemagglutinin family protein [Limnohabitans sp. MMS-10A-160]